MVVALKLVFAFSMTVDIIRMMEVVDFVVADNSGWYQYWLSMVTVIVEVVDDGDWWWWLVVVDNGGGGRSGSGGNWWL